MCACLWNHERTGQKCDVFVWSRMYSLKHTMCRRVMLVSSQQEWPAYYYVAGPAQDCPLTKQGALSNPRHLFLSPQAKLRTVSASYASPSSPAVAAARAVGCVPVLPPSAQRPWTRCRPLILRSSHARSRRAGSTCSRETSGEGGMLGGWIGRFRMW